MWARLSEVTFFYICRVNFDRIFPTVSSLKLQKADSKRMAVQFMLSYSRKSKFIFGFLAEKQFFICFL